MSLWQDGQSCRGWHIPLLPVGQNLTTASLKKPVSMMDAWRCSGESSNSVQFHDEVTNFVLLLSSNVSMHARCIAPHKHSTSVVSTTGINRKMSEQPPIPEDEVPEEKVTMAASLILESLPQDATAVLEKYASAPSGKGMMI